MSFESASCSSREDSSSIAWTLHLRITTEWVTLRSARSGRDRFHPSGGEDMRGPLSQDDVMSDASIDQLGPVDYLVVEFPAATSNFTGEMLKELLALVDGGTIRVIDMLILKKAADGSIDVVELEDLDDLGELQSIEAGLAEMLAEEDIVNLAAAMEPGSTAGVLIWENLWAAPFASAARRSGGQLIANGRIPIQGIIAAMEADEAMSSEGA
jgi:hypothetical protein